jgi:type II secretion system protein L
LALLCQTQPEINLLQGRFEVAAPWRRHLVQWRLPAAMAAVWLAVLGVGAFAEYTRLVDENAQLEAANREIFFEIMPDAQRYAGARMRVEKRLRELEGGVISESGLLPILAEAASALAQRKDIVLEQLQYRAGRLDVDLLANDTQILETLMQGFREKDLEPQLVSASRDGDKVRGRLRLTEGPGA